MSLDRNTEEGVLVLDLRNVLVEMLPEERVAVFAAVSDGFCVACGEVRIGTCHCENDE